MSAVYAWLDARSAWQIFAFFALLYVVVAVIGWWIASSIAIRSVIPRARHVDTSTARRARREDAA